MSYHQVSQQNSNSDLSNGGHIDRGLLLDGGAVKVPIRGKVDANSTITNELGRDLERLDGDTADNDVAQRKAVLQSPALLVLDLVAGLLDTLSSGEELNASDIHRVNGSTVVGEKSSKGTAVDL
jgi:hypothetical protein